MPLLFWDASALAKRYTIEIGSDTVDALFAGIPSAAMMTTLWGCAETFWILLRKLNDGRLDHPSFTAAAASLKNEVIDNPDFTFLAIDDTAILASLSLMQRHNINATDASLLAILLRFTRAQPSDSPPCVLITADRRFLRAAAAEGLAVFNPELITAADALSALPT